jgi:hypothetical protein
LRIKGSGPWRQKSGPPPKSSIPPCGLNHIENETGFEAREGDYLLRTNLTADSAADLWKKYMQLTEVEAAFRSLRSELRIRPLFHQLERRVKAHGLVAFLGYAQLVTLKHLLKAQCFGVFTDPSAETTLRTVQRRHRATDGGRTRDLLGELPRGRTIRIGYSINSTWSCRNVCSPFRS